MRNDIFIKFDGIDGEAAHANHPGEIALLSWRWGLTASAGLATGAASGKPIPQELRLSHRYDKASPLLAKAAAQGKRLKTAVLTAHAVGDKHQDFLRVTLKDVQITAISVSDTLGDEGLVEEISLAYGEVAFAYKPQDSKGSLGAEVGFNWNVKTTVIT